MNKFKLYEKVKAISFGDKIGIVIAIRPPRGTRDVPIYNVDFHDGYYSAELYEDFLIKLEEENEQMAKLTGYYAVAVTEEGTGCCKKDYYYAIFNDGNSYKTGDQILVNGCNKGILTIKELLTVPEAEVRCAKNITAEVISRVDTSAYDQRVENRKKAEKIKKDMDAVIKQMDATKKYEMYAAENPELAALLDQYKKLGENI